MSNLTTIKRRVELAQQELSSAARATAVTVLGELLGKLTPRDRSDLLESATLCLIEDPDLSTDRAKLLEEALEEAAAIQQDRAVVSRVRACDGGDRHAVARAARFDHYAAMCNEFDPHNDDIPDWSGEARDVPRFFVAAFDHEANLTTAELADTVEAAQAIASKKIDEEYIVQAVVDLDTLARARFDIQVRLGFE